jgi:hypothetical protein
VPWSTLSQGAHAHFPALYCEAETTRGRGVVGDSRRRRRLFAQASVWPGVPARVSRLLRAAVAEEAIEHRRDAFIPAATRAVARMLALRESAAFTLRHRDVLHAPDIHATSHFSAI